MCSRVIFSPWVIIPWELGYFPDRIDVIEESVTLVVEKAFLNSIPIWAI